MKMRAIQVTRANGPFEIVERGIPEPGTEQARTKIDGCGICHSDGLTEEGIWPGIRYARVPGRDIAGVIDALGGEVVGWTEGQGSGVGWHGGDCGYCDSCRRDDFVTYQVALQIPVISYDASSIPTTTLVASERAAHVAGRGGE